GTRRPLGALRGAARSTPRRLRGRCGAAGQLCRHHRGRGAVLRRAAADPAGAAARPLAGDPAHRPGLPGPLAGRPAGGRRPGEPGRRGRAARGRGDPLRVHVVAPPQRLVGAGHARAADHLRGGTDRCLRGDHRLTVARRSGIGGPRLILPWRPISKNKRYTSVMSGRAVVMGEEAAALPEGRFLDREEGWLRFNQRVLELAEDAAMPLLERVRFLAIFASNLDEFFMVRVAGLKRRLATGLAVPSPSGHHPKELLERISEVSQELMQRHARTFHDAIAPALADAGIRILRWEELGDTDRERMHRFFRRAVYPVLTPFAVDPAHPFPYISGRSLNLAVTVRDPRTGRTAFARIKVPPALHRFIRLEGDNFVPVEDVIAAHLPQLFAGMDVLEHHAFRVTRNADLEVDEDETDDLVQSLENELLRRRFGPLVRLEVEESITDEVLDILCSELGAEDEEVYRVPGPLNLAGLDLIADLDRPELSFSPMVPVEPPGLDRGDLFAAIDEGELLVHHPYESFATTIERF